MPLKEPTAKELVDRLIAGAHAIQPSICKDGSCENCKLGEAFRNNEDVQHLVKNKAVELMGLLILGDVEEFHEKILSLYLGGFRGGMVVAKSLTMEEMFNPLGDPHQ